MTLFDLFRRSRSPSAPNASHKRACCSVELLESRLVPSASPLPYPAGIVGAPPPAAQYGVGILAGPSAQNQPGQQVAPPAGANGDYGITWSSDAQDGTGWNLYPR